jgi:hypothetical protein
MAAPWFSRKQTSFHAYCCRTLARPSLISWRIPSKLEGNSHVFVPSCHPH